MNTATHKCFVLLMESCGWHILTIIEIAIQGILQACILVTIMGNDYGKCIFIVSVVGIRGAREQGAFRKVNGGRAGAERAGGMLGLRGGWIRPGGRKAPARTRAAA